MTKTMSFTKYENALLPAFRERMNQAESTEDVKKFFGYTVEELLRNVFQEDFEVRFEDVSLAPEADQGFTVAERLGEMEAFKTVWTGSDLPRILNRFAATAVRDYRHMEKNPAKTRAKINPVPDRIR